MVACEGEGTGMGGTTGLVWTFLFGTKVVCLAGAGAEVGVVEWREAAEEDAAEDTDSLLCFCKVK